MSRIRPASRFTSHFGGLADGSHNHISITSDAYSFITKLGR
jgi:hypothetical protein